MLLPLLLSAAVAAAPAAPKAPAPTQAPKTFRVDYFHTGNATEEHFSLERMVVEPLPWPGHPQRAIDDSGLGKYLFEVREQVGGKLVYSRGFASIYGEWEATPEATQVNRTFSESFRFPTPTRSVQVTLKKRGPKNEWKELWKLDVDPKGMFVDTSVPASPGPLLTLLHSGPSAQKVDFLILGDGYTQQQRAKFEKDARRLVDILFAFSPFKERKQDFNVWGLMPPAREPGISRPSTGIHKRNPVGST